MQALLAEPQAMLLDEPFAGLDHKLRNEMMNFTFEHLKAVNIPCLLVTHDQATADSTQRIIHL